MILRVVLVILIGTLSSVLGFTTPLTPSESYTNTLSVDDFDPRAYQIYWKLVGNGDEIQFEIHCRSLGWVGFGISPAGSMGGSDIMKFWIKDGITFLFDMHAVGNIPPFEDTIQNLQWLAGAEVNDYSMIKFKRRLATGDNQHDINIVDANQFFIFAWNPTDPVTGNGDWLYHGGNRFTKFFNLLAPGSG